MHIFSAEEFQKNLFDVLEMVANGKDVAIGGQYPTLLIGVKSVGNLSKDNPESGGSIIVFHADEEALNDEAVKPLPDEMIDEFYKPLPDDILAALEGR